MIDLSGQKFNRITVIRYGGKNEHNQIQWLCECDCGIKKIILGYNLKSGKTKSCGCLRVEKTKQRFTKHGHNKKNKMSKTYKSWARMIQRCNNPNIKNYHNYGGRGIIVCKRWKKFENFLEDMGEKPKGFQIDRINNNGNYCKSNCHWVTSKVNNRNRRNNHLITFNGKTQCVAAWAEELGINKTTIQTRFWRGWSIERALT